VPVIEPWLPWPKAASANRSKHAIALTQRVANFARHGAAVSLLVIDVTPPPFFRVRRPQSLRWAKTSFSDETWW
jgi:hypothetical protein